MALDLFVSFAWEVEMVWSCGVNQRLLKPQLPGRNRGEMLLGVGEKRILKRGGLRTVRFLSIIFFWIAHIYLYLFLTNRSSKNKQKQKP